MTMSPMLRRGAFTVFILLAASSLEAAPPPARVTDAKPSAPAAAEKAPARENGLQEPAASPTALRWTWRTPDQMLDLAARRSEGPEAGALAALAVIHALADRASAGRAARALEAIGQREGDVAAQARWLAAEIDPTAKAPPGLVRGFSILGPFQDSGGGLARREGPEQPGQTWGDPGASYAWGAYDVRWREVPAASVSARGVPLDLLIRPRKESCSYLATRVKLDDARTPL